MKTEIEFRSDRDPGGRTTWWSFGVPEILFAERYGLAVWEGVLHKVQDLLVERWMDAHAGEVLDKLSPDAVAAAVKNEIAKQFAGVKRA